MASPAYRPIAGRTPYDINMENAQIERQRRADLRMQNPYDVGLAMADPNWDSFFGGLHRAEDNAHENGLNFRFSPAGLGNGISFGEALNDGGGRLNSNDRANIAGNLAIGDLVDRRHAVMNAEQAHADARQGQIVDDLQGSYDRSRLDAAYAPKEDPTTITASPDGSKITMRPAGQPLSERDRILASVPGHIRMQLEPMFQQMDIAEREQKGREAATELNLRKERAAEGSNPLLGMAGAFTGKDGQPLQGNDVLQRLPAAVRNNVQGIIEGRQAMPSGTATKDPYWKSIIQIAQQVDPTFDAVDYNSRFKTRQNFTSGGAANQINAINTAIGHLSDFSDAADKLGNGSVDMLNSVRNHLTPGGSDRGVALNNFNTIKNGLTSELTRVWRQAGGSEQDIKDWASTIGDTKSKDELHGALNTIGGMLESKLSALDDQYRQGMGTNAVSVINQKARGHLDKLEGRSGAQRAAEPAQAAAPNAFAAPAEGAQKPIPGVPGSLAQFRGGKWVRVQ
jgi:hypothetical protein